MKYQGSILLIFCFITFSCNKKEKLPEYEIIQQKIYNCLNRNVSFPVNCWILLSGSEFTLSDFIVLKPIHSDSLTILVWKFAIADTNYIDRKNEFTDNCRITNDITGKEFKVFFTTTIQKNISKEEIQFNKLLKKSKRVGDSPCRGFDPVSTSLTEFRNGEFIKISTCKDSKHPVQTFYNNIVKTLSKVQ